MSPAALTPSSSVSLFLSRRSQAQISAGMCSQLRLLATAAARNGFPYEDAASLALRVATLLDKGRCAALLRASGFPPRSGLAAPFPQAGDVAAGTLEALAGAYFLELGGDAFSVTKFWELLAGSPELAPALPTVARTSRRFRGNTPTHEHLQEVLCDGVPTLEVCYQGTDTLRYCRPAVDTGGCGAEFVTSCVDPRWAPIVFDPPPEHVPVPGPPAPRRLAPGPPQQSCALAPRRLDAAPGHQSTKPGAHRAFPGT